MLDGAFAWYQWLDSQLGGKLNDIGLIIVGTLVPWAYGFFKRLWLAWKFRLTGEYLTTYDHANPKDGETEVYARSRIKQKGRKLFISTTESNGRVWQQTAIIVRDRYISGWYSSQDPFDTGVGTFFLVIEGKRLVGHWYGHSHTTQNMRSGNYEFIKMKEPLIIERLDDSQIAAVLEISDKVFGANYLSAAELKLPTSHVFTAVKNGRLVGFSLVRLLPANELAQVLPQTFFETSALRHCNSSGKVGIIKSVATDDEHPNDAVGTRLFTFSEKHLFAAGAKAILVPVWQTGTSRRFENVAKVTGYDKIYEDPAYWKAGCDNGQFKCKAKGNNGNCVCRCVFFMKTDRRPRSFYKRFVERIPFFGGKSS